MNVIVRLQSVLLRSEGIGVGATRRNNMIRWFGVVLCVGFAIAFILAIFQPFFRGQDIAGSMSISEIELVGSKGPEFVQLPHRWSNDKNPKKQQQYTLTFTHQKLSSDGVSVYFPSVSKNFQITINGSVIPALGDVGPNPSWNFNRPHLLSLPSSLLFDGDNHLLLDVFADSNYDGSLGIFYLGDSNALLSAWQFETLLTSGVVYLILFMALVFTVIAGIYSLKIDIHFRWVTIACLFAALTTPRWLVSEPWLSAAQFLAFNELMVSSFIISVIIFLYRFNETSHTQIYIQRVILISLWSIELALVLFSTDFDTVYEITRWTKTVFNITGIFMLVSCCVRYMRNLNVFRVLFISNMLVLNAGGVHDQLMRFAVWDSGMEYRFHLSILYLVCAAFVYFLTDAARQAEDLVGYRADLESQVDGFSSRLDVTRQRLIETQQWSALGYSSLQLWRKLKSPLHEIFESSSHIHTVAPEHQHEARLMGLSYRSMYCAQRCLRTIDEMELLVGEPVVELIELDMERWMPELLRELHKLHRIDLRLGSVDKCVVNGDPYLLRDCIERLVENSDRACGAHSQRGEVKVSVSSTSDFVVLAVIDNGPGISASLVARLNEPLHQGEPNGLGVGLCIVKHYAQIMGISVRSRVQARGACIELVFPRVH